jgi:uncharacterized membrane protein YccC
LTTRATGRCWTIRLSTSAGNAAAERTRVPGAGSGWALADLRALQGRRLLEAKEAAEKSVVASSLPAIVFGVVLGGAAAIGVALGWTEPYWVPEPILVLALYVLIGKRDRIRGKAIGTALGVAAATPVAIIDPPAGVLAAVAAIAFVLALTQAKKYSLMYGLYTFSLVLLLASPGQVGFEAEERGFQILVGIGLLVVGLGIIHSLSTWLSKRDPQPELAPAA